MSKPKKSAAVPRTQDWLNGAERDRLRVLEVGIEQGRQGLLDIGRNLIEIRESRLYRENHDTFETYCKLKWNFSRSRAYELMTAAGVVRDLSGNPDTPAPRSAGVASALAPLRYDPESMKQTWEKVTAEHGPKATAEHVRAASKPALAAAPEPAASVEDSRFDRLEDAVALLQQMPHPDALLFPSEQGDVEVIGEALDWIVKWAPQAKAAWKRHLAAQRQHARAVA